MPPGEGWTFEEWRRLDALVAEFRRRSARTCERCGAEGLRRESRRIRWTLCDGCEQRVGEGGRIR